MKILGYINHQGTPRFTMKCDSSLLNNRKPFFIPDWSHDVLMRDCLVVRISRLGKCIRPKFADRYYDAIAWGIDACAHDWLETNPAQACAFDSSLIVGNWITPEEAMQDITIQPILTIEHAIAQASEIVTLRQGDFIFIDSLHTPVKAVPDTIISRTGDVSKKELLYCKIK